MAITVQRGVLSRVCRAEDFAIRVEGADDVRAARRALGRAREDFVQLGDWSGRADAPMPPKHVSAVLPSTSGPFVTLNCRGVRDEARRRIPEIVAARLTEEGVTDAVITAPSKYGVIRLPRLPKCAVLWLYPPTPRTLLPRDFSEIPDAWLQQAVSWVADGHDGELWAVVENFEMTVAISDAVELLVGCREARALQVQLIAVGEDRFRRLWAGMYAPPLNLAIAAGGPATSDDELFDHVAELRKLAIALPDVAYANVSIDPGAYPQPSQETQWLRDRPHVGGVEFLYDEFVVDAFAWQLLGPRHLARLGTTPPGAHTLDDGFIELWIGKPRDWFLDPWLPDDEEPWFPWAQDLPSRRADPNIQQRANTACAMSGDRATTDT